MGTIFTYTHPGEDGGTWYAAQYPLGATRYYSTEDARFTAMVAYRTAIQATGGNVSFCAI